MSIDLPKAIAAYFTADRDNSEGFAQCFAEQAIVKDEGHTYVGRAAIAAWKAESTAKYTYTCEPFAIELRDGRIVVTSHLVGNFPGSPVDLRYAFALDKDQIIALEVTP